jgi:hypothetical protein
MKFNKSKNFYAIVFIIFIIYMFSANYIFNIILKTDAEARLVSICLPLETNNIISALNVKESNKLKWKDALELKGWVFKENVKEKNRDTYLVLKSENRTNVFEIANDSILRPDLNLGFKMKGGIENHGFEMHIPSYWIYRTKLPP